MISHAGWVPAALVIGKLVRVTSGARNAIPERTDGVFLRSHFPLYCRGSTASLREMAVWMGSLGLHADGRNGSFFFAGPDNLLEAADDERPGQAAYYAQP